MPGEAHTRQEPHIACGHRQTCADPSNRRWSRSCRIGRDLDLWNRDITVHGKGRKTRTVKIGYDAARALDRYIPVRARHAQAHRPQLWLGSGSRGPMTASGIYQVIARRGRQCGVEVFPHRFRAPFQPYLAGPRRRRGRPDGTQRLDVPADAAPLRRQRPRRQSPPQLRPRHGRHTVTSVARPGPWA